MTQIDSKKGRILDKVEHRRQELGTYFCFFTQPVKMLARETFSLQVCFAPIAKGRREGDLSDEEDSSVAHVHRRDFVDGVFCNLALGLQRASVACEAKSLTIASATFIPSHAAEVIPPA